MEAYSLFEVNQYIKRVLALNFDEPFWVECEINQISESRNNLYLDLIQKDDRSEEIIARNSATIWYRQQMFIRRKLGELYHSVLADGVGVKLKVNVAYSERYGLSLNILDVDAAYTFGQFELNRQKIINRLRKENLLDVNKALPLPIVIRRIAVISSPSAAGYQDFRNQLAHNVYGFTFTTDLFPAAMQGRNTEAEVVAALKRIAALTYDAVAIIRGGGSKLDLASFDNYNIACAIANMNIPVFTGIGHDIDLTVTDLVAHKVLKTPTAVADFILEKTQDFESEVNYLWQQVQDRARHHLSRTALALANISQELRSGPRLLLQAREQAINNLVTRGHYAASRTVASKKAMLEQMAHALTLLDPVNVLNRGFTIVRKNDQIVPRKKDLQKGSSHLTIEFSDGIIDVLKEK